MEITEVRVKLVPPGEDKLRAFCSITIDNSFVIRDLKIIEGAKGAFVAMPSRKLTKRCRRCGGKNHTRAQYCNDCGLRLAMDRGARWAGSRAKLHADIAHPINSECRKTIQRCVLDSYQEELDRAGQPGYEPPDLDEFEVSLLGGGSRRPAKDGPSRPAARERWDEERSAEPAEDVPWSDGQRHAERVAAGSPEGRPEIAASGAPSSHDDPTDTEVAEAEESAVAEGSTRHAVREVRPARRSGRGRRPSSTPREEKAAEARGSGSGSGGGAARRGYLEDLDTEPEDNFGAGLFS